MSQQFGLMTGTVIDVNDPANRGRVRLNFSWMSGKSDSDWTPVAAPMAGNKRGVFVMPEVGDEVVVGFDRGDTSHPIVVGYLWNGKDAPPSTSPRERMWRSLNGHAIRMLDTEPNAGDTGALVIEDGHGNRITMSNGKVTVHSKGVLELKGAVVMLTSSGVSRIVTPNGNPI
jgi:phage baseplate assembly protein V